MRRERECLSVPWAYDEGDEEVRIDRKEGGEEQLQQLDVPTETTNK